MQVIMVDHRKCTGCHQCELWCGNEIASESKEMPFSFFDDPQPIPRVFVEGKSFALQCRHCPDAPCLDACPNGSMTRDENKMVYVNETSCIACWMCVMACPFGVINPYSTMKVAIKCDRCRNMGYPICVEICPTDALLLVEREETVNPESKA